MHLLLVRHGESESNLRQALDTAVPGADLTDLGRQQARGLGQRLSDVSFDGILASPLARAQQTAAPLANQLGLDVVVRDGLREALAGDLEMRTDDASVRVYLKTYLAWINGRLDVRMPGGETGAEVVSRVDAVLEEIQAQGHESVVVVSHGATVRTWCAARAENLDPDFVAKNPVHNCGAVLLTGTFEGGWRVVTWQDQAIGGHDANPHDPAAQTPADLPSNRE